MSRSSPAVRSALIAVAICLVLCPLIGFVVWPVADWAIAMLASLREQLAARWSRLSARCARCSTT